MNIDIIKRANRALIKKKTLDSYDLPKNLKQQIANTSITREQINAAYVKVTGSAG